MYALTQKSINTMKNSIQFYFLLLLCGVLISSCGRGGDDERSTATGFKFDSPEGYEKLDYEGQTNGPNLVLVEGGTFTMGLTEEDVTFEWNNIPRRITVSSFYMEETEVSNHNYREYLNYLKKTYISYPEVHRNALPDTLVWREELAYNEPLVGTYFRHPAYDNYPVVGVNWLQSKDYCNWRSNAVNKMLLQERGIMNETPDEKDSEAFDTDAYFAGQYEGSVKKNLQDTKTGGERKVRLEDGITLPGYRLPTEAEWEYAALALQGNQSHSEDELITDRKIYPWNGTKARYEKHGRQQGKILANFKRGRGDYMGMSGNLNDKASRPGPIRQYLPNDFGLYNMAGNVSEWTADVYRPLTSLDLSDAESHDLDPYRGNRFTELVVDEDGRPVEKDSMGRLQRRYVDDEEVADRENYKKADLRNYLDGDNSEFVSYGYGDYTLISDKARVIKGGSWADRLFWLSPGARRFKDEDKSDRTLGFRCAMIRVGGSVGNEDVGGNTFKESGRKIKRRYK